MANNIKLIFVIGIIILPILGYVLMRILIRTSKIMIENKVIEYIEENYETIEKDMNSRNSTSKRKDSIVDNSKTRKKREELSVSAIKSIKKEEVEIVVQFH